MGAGSMARFQISQNRAKLAVMPSRAPRCACHSRGAMRPSCQSCQRGSVRMSCTTSAGECRLPSARSPRARLASLRTITPPMSKIRAGWAQPPRLFCGRCGSAARAQCANNRRKDGKENYDEDNPVDALVDVGDGAAEKVAAENHASDPEDSPKDVIAEIPRVRHLSGAGDRRAESPDDGNKASQDDRLSAVLFIEIVGAPQMAAAEKEGIFAAVQGVSGAASNPITELVAGDGAQGHQCHQGQKRSNGKVAGAGKNAC